MLISILKGQFFRVSTGDSYDTLVFIHTEHQCIRDLLQDAGFASKEGDMGLTACTNPVVWPEASPGTVIADTLCTCVMFVR